MRSIGQGRGLSRCIASLAYTGLVALGLPHVATAATDTLPAFTNIDSIDARLQGCVTCHGQNGEGTSSRYYPRIAGKPAGYLYNQLTAFRDGTRRYAPMNYLLAYLPDAYLREMADRFAKARPLFDQSDLPSVDADVLGRGQHIATQGDAEHQIPACIGCHGAGLTGMQPGIPGLVGLAPQYIEAQLTRWRVGSRHAAEPDCMKRIASRLSEADIASVAAWLSRQPPPKDVSPASSDVVRMPLACGSQQ